MITFGMARSLAKGPPGARRTRKKVIVTTQKSTTTMELRRRATNTNMGGEGISVPCSCGNEDLPALEGEEAPRLAFFWRVHIHCDVSRAFTTEDNPRMSEI